MSKEALALILGVIGVLLVINGAISLARFVVSLIKRAKTITITSDDLELIHEALAEYEQSFRDYQDAYPEDMTDDELDRMIRRVRDVDSAIFDLEANTPVTVEVKPS